MPSFKVIRASAGSGKTFNLTHEYLRLLYKERDNFMHILAVTFTNKATEEMKSRIIGELYALASDKHSKQLEGLKLSTGLSEKQLRDKAGIILKRLLHKYSGFSVTTIDSFFQRIIRNFTRELGIQEGYSIELDTDAVLTEAINGLLLKSGSDKPLLAWLTMFAESLIEKGENWNFRKGIRSLGREIFREEFKSLDEEAVRLFSNRDFLTDYKSELYALHQNIEENYRRYGQEAKAVIESHGLTVDDFSNKSRGPAGFLVKLATGEFREPTQTAGSAATEIKKWYTADSPRKNEIIEAAEQKLMPLMQQVIDYYQANHRAYFTAAVVLKNLYTLGILSDLSQLADAWCSDNNTFLLPEAPVFLNKIIDGNDTPFIYEKAGCWYHHFMIDEFQDTSILQWLNFKPLISNSLSQDYDNLAVGDVKQSIYRWRNSNWEILDSVINRDFLPGIMDHIVLKENWRSRENIISFNNHFFNKAANILQKEYDQLLIRDGYNKDIVVHKSISDLYLNAEQVSGKPDNKNGYVQVDFIAEEADLEFTDTVNNKLITVLCELQDKGYELHDIAILTRKNREAKALADFLLNYGNTRHDPLHRFDVISDEALRLGSSTLVNTLIGLLQYIIDPLDRTNLYFLVSTCKNYIDPSAEKKIWMNSGGKESESAENPDQSFPSEFMALTRSQSAFSLVEIVERLIKIFQLEIFNGEKVYLQAFRDMVIEYSRKYSGDISRFLEYWHETGYEKSVSSPAGQDAIRILTLHKSKGLEFKITIIPYCTWELNNTHSGNILWCNVNEKPFDKLPVLPLSFSSKLQNTIFAVDYFRECHRQYVDNLNLLYVAFTRAQEALFVFCKSRGEDQLKSVSDLSGKVLGSASYTLGTLLPNETSGIYSKSETVFHSPVQLTTVSDRIKIAFQGQLFIDPTVNKPLRPVNEGKILHELFTLIRNTDDIPVAINRMLLQGKISAVEKERYSGMIEMAMKDPQVSLWFSPEWNVLSEAEIILPDGAIRRPDRVMTRNGLTCIIDFKFGTKIEAAHENQVREYLQLLQEMGYGNAEAFLWYVKLGRVVRL